MALLALDIHPAPPTLPEDSGQPIPLRVEFDNLGRGLLPGRGLAGSFVLHVIALALILVLPSRLGALFPRKPAVEQETADLETQTVIYLPRLGGGSEGKGRPGGGPEVHRQGSNNEPAKGNKGVSYPGPQEVVSNPPRATNHIQTILQPALKNPKALVPLIPVPNIVQTTNAGPLPTVDSPQLVKPLPSLQMRAPAANARAAANLTTPIVPTPAATPQDLPKLAVEAGPVRPALPMAMNPSVANRRTAADSAAPVVPAPQAAPQDLPKLAADAGPVRPALPMAMNAPVAQARPNAQTNVAPPTQFSPVPTQGTDFQNLVALSPVPAPPAPTLQLPAGETRGSFAITPGAALTAGGGAPGAKSGSNPTAFGTGNDTTAPIGNAASEGAEGNSKSGLPVGGKGGEGTSTVAGLGTGNGGPSATGEGRGAAVAGAGLGTGSGSSTGSGAKAGAGRGAGPFAGITIQGGEGVTGAAVAAASRNAITVVQPQSYSMTVVSTASSGGGLADFGVFAKEPVYTVYLDMRTTPDDPAASWTLQYALLKPPSTDDPASITGELVPPFPSNKVPLNLPAELVRKYRTRQVVVYAIVDTDGKIRDLAVKQSPGEEINKPIQDALSKWSFRPAEVDGLPVAVKVLIGIPIV